MAASITILRLWVLLPIYLILVNTLSEPGADVAGWPKQLLARSFDLGNLTLLRGNYQGVARALLINSILVAAMTIDGAGDRSSGAPAGYALARFDFPGQEPLPHPGADDPGLSRCPCWPCLWRSSSSRSGWTIRGSGLPWYTPCWRCRLPS